MGSEIIIYTVQGSNKYTVCLSIFRDFSHTIGRELKEIANKLVRIGTLAAMLLRKNVDDQGEA